MQGKFKFFGVLDDLDFRLIWGSLESGRKSDFVWVNDRKKAMPGRRRN